jgi:hypothetical protein
MGRVAARLRVYFAVLHTSDGAPAPLTLPEDDSNGNTSTLPDSSGPAAGGSGADAEQMLV